MMTTTTDSTSTNSSLRYQPRLLVITFFALYLLLWVLLPVLLNSEIPGDNIEQLAWSQIPAWGYSKHPPFPTWVLCLFALVFPKGVPLTYALGGLQVAVTLLIAWRLMNETLGSHKALLATVLVTCITYHSNRVHFYNHNTALLVASAASIYCVWRCSRSQDLKWWIALGLCWAVGMLSKYQMALTIACNLIFLYTARAVPLKQLVGRVALAGLLSLLLISPHILWLYTNHFPSFAYASESLSLGLSLADRTHRSLSFFADQLVRLVPMLLLLGILTRLAPKQPSTREQRLGTASQVRTLLAIHAAGPLVMMLLISLILGANLQTHWGTAFLWVIPLWLVSTEFGDRLAAIDPRRVLVAASCVQVIMAIAFAMQL